MAATLSNSQVQDFTNQLSGFLVNSEMNKLIENQGEIRSYQKKIETLRSSTAVYNKEFDERHNAITPYKMPTFATNQDIMLIGFLFSYGFLTLVSLIVLYKNTQNIQNVLYAFLMSGFILLIITALLLRLG